MQPRNKIMLLRYNLHKNCKDQSGGQSIHTAPSSFMLRTYKYCKFVLKNIIQICLFFLSESSHNLQMYYKILLNMIYVIKIPKCA